MRTNVATRRPPVAKKASGIQYAALPYRVAGGRLQVLLVTSRRTRRWIVPKGWPVDSMPASACAALEALEEAGVKGEVQKTPIGHYRYVKHHKNRASEPCKVEVYALKVTEQRKSWAEGDERERRWYSPAEAAAVVAEPLLQHLILEFEAQLLASAAH
jgi:8-oxo-dGTP pyrophosphatase MutT (NUDIX family)